MARRDVQIAAPPQLRPRSRTEQRREHRNSIVTKADQPLIEGRIPQGRQKQSVVYIQPLGIAFADPPRHDMRGAQESRVRNARQWATPLPIIHQAGTEYILPDPLHDQPFRVGRPWQRRGLLLELFQRRVGQTSCQLIDPRQHGVHRCGPVEGISHQTRPGHVGHRQRQRLDHPSMIQRQIPRPLRPGRCQMDRPRHCGRGEPGPAGRATEGAAKPVLPSGLFAFRGHDK